MRTKAHGVSNPAPRGPMSLAQACTYTLAWSFLVILKSLTSWFQCVYSAEQWPSMSRIGQPWRHPRSQNTVDNVVLHHPLVVTVETAAQSSLLFFSVLLCLLSNTSLIFFLERVDGKHLCLNRVYGANGDLCFCSNQAQGNSCSHHPFLHSESNLLAKLSG